MERFFKMSSDEVKFIMKDLKDEVIEEYFGGPEEKSPEDITHEEAIMLIGLVYKFVKTQDYQERNLGMMMAYLKALAQKETLFLSEWLRCGTSEQRVLRIIKEGNTEAVFLAVKYLSYFRTYFLDKNDPANDPFFDAHENWFDEISEENKGGENEMEDSALSILSRLRRGVASPVTPPLSTPSMAKPPKMDRNFPIELKRYLDEHMIGQDELKKKLAMEVYHHLKGCSNKVFLMIGDTGSGKNYSISLLKKFLMMKGWNRPFVYCDASQLTAAGFTGASVEDVLKQYMKEFMRCGGQHGFIFLDEIDKIIKKHIDSSGENFNDHVQGQLLSMLAGETVYGVDCSKVLIIPAGAFEDLKHLKERRKVKETARIGFGKENIKAEQKTSIRDDLISIGMKRELLGRISTIVQLERLDKDAIRSILLHDKVGAIAIKKQEYKEDELELFIDPEVVDEIVERVWEQNLGARGITNVVEDVVGNFNYEMIEQGYSYIRIHAGVLSGEPPILGRSENDVSLKVSA